MSLKEIEEKVSEIIRIIEIINDYYVDIIYLKNSKTIVEYNNHFGAVVRKLPKQHYDLLKRYF